MQAIPETTENTLFLVSPAFLAIDAFTRCPPGFHQALAGERRDA
jgi:hypothetical protein